MKVLTAEQMQEVDRRAIEECGIPGVVLMENAGRGVAALLAERLEAGSKVSIICGGGNNGGDGFVAARYLHKWGYQVVVYLCAKEDALKGDAATHYAALRSTDAPVRVVAGEADLEGAAEEWAESDALVDALLGTGLKSEVEGYYRAVVEAMNERRGALVVAVDVPSGLNSDTGMVMGVALRADVTVTMGLPKVGLYTGDGPDCAGEVVVWDIGMSDECLREAKEAAELIEREEVRGLLPRFPKTAHKGTRGRVLVVAGSRGFTGAAALCSEACLLAGAGMSFLALPASLNAVMEAKLTEVITVPVAEGEEGTLGIHALEHLKDRLEGCDALVIGPGLSRGYEARQVALDLMESVSKPTVVDADGLNALVGQAERLRKAQAPMVVTPHLGEMARLTELEVSEVRRDAVQVARRFAAEQEVVVVLKQARTVVAAPGGETYICPLGNPGMGTAGTGDVLTGVIGGLLAQGMGALEAAMCGVYVHALAGDLVAAEEGERGVLAGKILRGLPEAFRLVEEGDE